MAKSLQRYKWIYGLLIIRFLTTSVIRILICIFIVKITSVAYGSSIDSVKQEYKNGVIDNNSEDSEQYIPFFNVDGTKTLTIKNSEVEITTTINKSIYQNGDTLKLKLVITCVGDTAIMVMDPKYFMIDYSIDATNNIIYCNLGLSIEGQLFCAPKLVKILHSQSIEYSSSISLNDSLIISNNKNLEWYIDFGLQYWQYQDSLAYLTMGTFKNANEAIIGLKNNHDMVYWIYLSRVLDIGKISFKIWKDISNAIIHR